MHAFDVIGIVALLPDYSISVERNCQIGIEISLVVMEGFEHLVSDFRR